MNTRRLISIILCSTVFISDLSLIWALAPRSEVLAVAHAGGEDIAPDWNAWVIEFDRQPLGEQKALLMKLQRNGHVLLLMRHLMDRLGLLLTRLRQEAQEGLSLSRQQDALREVTLFLKLKYSKAAVLVEDAALSEEADSLERFLFVALDQASVQFVLWEVIIELLQIFPGAAKKLWQYHRQRLSADVYQFLCRFESWLTLNRTHFRRGNAWSLPEAEDSSLLAQFKWMAYFLVQKQFFLDRKAYFIKHKLGVRVNRSSDGLRLMDYLYMRHPDFEQAVSEKVDQARALWTGGDGRVDIAKHPWAVAQEYGYDYLKYHPEREIKPDLKLFFSHTDAWRAGTYREQKIAQMMAMYKPEITQYCQDWESDLKQSVLRNQRLVLDIRKRVFVLLGQVLLVGLGVFSVFLAGANVLAMHFLGASYTLFASWFVTFFYGLVGLFVVFVVILFSGYAARFLDLFSEWNGMLDRLEQRRDYWLKIKRHISNWDQLVQALPVYSVQERSYELRPALQRVFVQAWGLDESAFANNHFDLVVPESMEEAGLEGSVDWSLLQGQFVQRYRDALQSVWVQSLDIPVQLRLADDQPNLVQNYYDPQLGQWVISWHAASYGRLCQLLDSKDNAAVQSLIDYLMLFEYFKIQRRIEGGSQPPLDAQGVPQFIEQTDVYADLMALMVLKDRGLLEALKQGILLYHRTIFPDVELGFDRFRDDLEAIYGPQWYLNFEAQRMLKEHFKSRVGVFVALLEPFEQQATGVDLALVLNNGPKRPELEQLIRLSLYHIYA